MKKMFTDSWDAVIADSEQHAGLLMDDLDGADYYFEQTGYISVCIDTMGESFVIPVVHTWERDGGSIAVTAKASDWAEVNPYGLFCSTEFQYKHTIPLAATYDYNVYITLPKERR